MNGDAALYPDPGAKKQNHKLKRLPYPGWIRDGGTGGTPIRDWSSSAESF